MIKGVLGGTGVVVSGGSASVPYINMNSGSMGNPMQGMVRINGSDLQVFDGTAWLSVQSSYVTVDLNGDYQSIIEWARVQRDKQYKREALVKDNPALKKAMEAIERAEANFDILAKFVENDNSTVASA